MKPQDDERLSRGVGISFALHAAILGFFSIKAAFFTPEAVDFSQAIRVDMVALPDKHQPKVMPPPAKDEPKPAPVEKIPEKPPTPPKTEKAEPEKVVSKPLPTKKEDSINLDKVKNEQKSALEKLKAMAALEKIKQDVEEQKKAAGSGKAETVAPVVKGNVITPGSSLTGLNKLQHETYAVDLDRHIKQFWALPEWLAKRDLKAQARVFLDSRGNILGRKIVASSGNPSYDEEVLDTIDRAAPFPAPPEKFLALVSVDGILIGFPE
ncbi:MAG: TonB family protein [Bdellovibrio sp.]